MTGTGSNPATASGADAGRKGARALFAANPAPRSAPAVARAAVPLFALCAGLLLSLASLGAAAPARAQANGIGPDPDGDSNPATDVFGFYQVGEDSPPRLDAPFKTIDFEPPPARHGEVLRTQYRKDFGVTFSRGLKLQVCEGQRYFQYDTQCTYDAPPSGRYAAMYHDDIRRPLIVRFDRPVCAAALSVYPTGGADGEKFRVTLDLYRKTPAGEDRKIGDTKVEFTWSKDTVRWRSKIIAFLQDKSADRMDVSVRSLDKKKKQDNIDFLIDDIAYIERPTDVETSPCQQMLDELVVAAAE